MWSERASFHWRRIDYLLWRRASVIAPHNSMMKSSVKPNASKSELSMASAKSIEFVLFAAKSHICKRVNEDDYLIY